MVIRVNDDDPHALLDLLWIREAWGLRPEGAELPPALVDTPDPVDAELRESAPLVEWQRAWPELWRACLLHAGTPRHDTVDRMNASEPGSPERARLIRELAGPSWRQRFGRAAFTPGHEEWNRARFDHQVNRRPRRVEESPERVTLEALIAAWRAGLTDIVELPCRGEFTRVLGAHSLVLTAETRADPLRYGEALAQFR